MILLAGTGGCPALPSCEGLPSAQSEGLQRGHSCCAAAWAPCGLLGITWHTLRERWMPPGARTQSAALPPPQASNGGKREDKRAPAPCVPASLLEAELRGRCVPVRRGGSEGEGSLRAAGELGAGCEGQEPPLAGPEPLRSDWPRRGWPGTRGWPKGAPESPEAAGGRGL